MESSNEERSYNQNCEALEHQCFTTPKSRSLSPWFKEPQLSPSQGTLRCPGISLQNLTAFSSDETFNNPKSASTAQMDKQSQQSFLGHSGNAELHLTPAANLETSFPYHSTYDYISKNSGDTKMRRQNFISTDFSSNSNSPKTSTASYQSHSVAASIPSQFQNPFPAPVPNRVMHPSNFAFNKPDDFSISANQYQMNPQHFPNQAKINLTASVTPYESQRSHFATPCKSLEPICFDWSPHSPNASSKPLPYQPSLLQPSSLSATYCSRFASASTNSAKMGPQEFKRNLHVPHPVPTPARNAAPFSNSSHFGSLLQQHHQLTMDPNVDYMYYPTSEGNDLKTAPLISYNESYVDNTSPQVELPPSSGKVSPFTSQNILEKSQELNNNSHPMPRYVKDLVTIQPVYRRQRYIEVPITQMNTKYVPKIVQKEVPQVIHQIFNQYLENIVEEPKIEEISYEVEIPRIVESYRRIPQIEILEHIVPRTKPIEIEESQDIDSSKTEKLDQIVEMTCKSGKIRRVAELEALEWQPSTAKQIVKAEPKNVEVLNFVTAPIEYIDYYQNYYVAKTVTEEVERLVDTPEIQDTEVDIEVPFFCEKIIDIQVEVPVYYDEIKIIEVPGKVIDVKVERLYEKIIENPIEVPEPAVKLIQVLQEDHIDEIKEIPMVTYEYEEIEDCKLVQLPAPPLILKPLIQQEVIDVDPIHELGEPMTMVKA